LRCGIQHEAHFRTDCDAAGLRCRQEESHVNVAEIDEIKHASAGGNDFSGLRHAELHAPVAWRCE